MGLALFQPGQTDGITVWSGVSKVGRLSGLESLRPCPLPDGPSVQFNSVEANVGLIAVDNTHEPSIRFCEIEELARYPVKPTGRYITHLRVSTRVRINAWNSYIKSFREQTRDVLMTPYRGIRKDGMYRRRLDWGLARGIIHHA